MVRGAWIVSTRAITEKLPGLSSELVAASAERLDHYCRLAIRAESTPALLGGKCQPLGIYARQAFITPEMESSPCRETNEAAGAVKLGT